MGSHSSSPHLFLFLLLSVVFFRPAAPAEALDGAAADEKQDRNALEIIIGGGGRQIDVDPSGITKTWRGRNVCKYKGFDCARLPDKGKVKGVTGVNLNGKGLGNSRGNLSLNGFIEKLEDLVYFHANTINFNSIFFKNISKKKLRYFYELDLSNNKLKGGFPRAVLSGNRLTFLDLRFNSLTGRLPPEVFDLDLRALFLNNNGFNGKIPDNIGRTRVFYLTLASNKFEGPLPESLVTNSTSNRLIEVLFTNNLLSGCLPYQIGLLKRNALFDVSINRLKGPIPHSFACLREMRLLNLSYNEFSGVVPETICKLPKLDKLSLQNNYFTQVGPECRKRILQKRLDVSMNCIIDLPRQRKPSDCKKFYLKPFKCPNERLLSKVPCKLDHLLADVDASESDPAQDIAPSPAYAALDPEYTYPHN
ncbi:hypothetical protein CRG98_046239 [Punica granatum]|uniref:Leucine-rich repeat-containing N-terminal plant-type domain-containing protein n=1 Tax=Punica granatum TaxID=22663 RepID=A0A2I0HP83_PUNGR|nr:hypothetical protein CRG98_046239 [Punica granatum]